MLVCWALALLGAGSRDATAQNSAVRPVEGIRATTPNVHAFVGARIVLSPGVELARGTLVIRDGRIVALGAQTIPPTDARIWPSEGKTIYAGLIDAYSEQAFPEEATKHGAPHWSGFVTPQLRMADYYRPDGGLNGKWRGQGIVARLVAPASGIWKGSSAVVTTDDGAADRAVVRADAAHHLRLTIPRGGRREFPNSPMGAVALARQTLLDAAWYRAAWNAARSDSLLPRPEQNDALETLGALTSGEPLVIADASDEQFLLRADQFAREFSLRLVVRGSGREYRRLDAVRATGRAVIVPVDFPAPPYVATADAATTAPLEDLMHWDLAPENPARLEKAGVKITLTSHGLREPAEFLARVRKAVKRGLPKEAALRALTTTPAELLQIDAQLGSLAVGKSASFLVTTGDLFDDATKIEETWVAGKRFELQRSPALDPRGQWTVTLQGPSGTVGQFRWSVLGELDKPRGELIVTAPTPPAAEPKPGADGKPADPPAPTPPAEQKVGFEHFAVNDGRFGAVVDAKPLGRVGKASFAGVVTVQLDRSTRFEGEFVWPDGTRSPLVALRAPPASPAKPEEKPAEKPAEKPGEKPADTPAAKPASEGSPSGALYEVNYPLGPYGRQQTPEQPAAILLHNGTIWTCGPQGKIVGGALLIGGGRVLAVGKREEIQAPPNAVAIDLKGAHVSPGIIDCHSHMATDGGVNESSQACTAEVRIGDFIDATDITIYRQLAGGVTAAHVLHGSANPIGGQCQLIKLRWGGLPEEMKFVEAPATIKFALGENVKQSNWGAQATGRYPQSRMGVDEFFRDTFEAAKRYRDEQARWARSRIGLPPRRDLELDAIVEILDKRRWIHCHSYRQDEILAFLRAMEDMKVRVGTLQHILEGYKVADAIAKHGAGASSFSDWWSYKVEVFDSIPHNAALMHKAGIVVSLNSDDRELARHLNHEAAKAMKYGGVPEEQALQFVTLNPAKQLFVDSLVGSLEPGKHADFVVWSGAPLSTMSRCEQTWVDGRKYFDRVDDQAERARIVAMRAALVQKVLSSGEGMREAGEVTVVERELWPREDEFCHHHPHHRHAHDEHDHAHEQE